MDNWKARLIEQYTKRLDALEVSLTAEEGVSFGRLEELLIEEESIIMKELLAETVKAFPPSRGSC